MNLLIVGHGAREAYLTELIRAKGHQVTAQGPWRWVILPLPKGEVDADLAAQLPPGQPILCGLPTPALQRLAQEKGWKIVSLLADPAFVQENARLSAEGAIYYAMQAADFALKDAHCLVLGYGRIGQALTALLRSLGARVTVAARRRESREAAGEGSVDFPKLPHVLPHVQVVFNTIPAPVIGRELLSLLPRTALLMELASPPYGIDLATAQKMTLRAWLESGIPGRYCPQSAAQAVVDFIERSARHE